MPSLVSLIILITVLFGATNGDQPGVSYDAGLSAVMQVLSKVHASGSLEYWGRCETHFNRFELPKLRLSGKVTADDPVAALSELFRDDPEMRVGLDENGFIRMVDANTPADLLQVRIKHIPLKRDDIFPPTDVRFDSRDALGVILLAPEVLAFMKSHNIEQRFPFEFVTGRRPMPSPALPHLSQEMNNVTLSQALDDVLRTFPGLWVYEVCPGNGNTHIVDFGIFTNGPTW
jgi:hypothetical protein